jgi:hypothetical protein
MSTHFSRQSAVHHAGGFWTILACMGVLLIGSVQMSEPLQSAAHFTAPAQPQHNDSSISARRARIEAGVRVSA